MNRITTLFEISALLYLVTFLSALLSTHSRAGPHEAGALADFRPCAETAAARQPEGRPGKVRLALRSNEEHQEEQAPTKVPPIHAWVLDISPEDVEKYLKEHPKAVTARDERGLTALHWACRRGKRECVQALIKHGADVNAESTGGDYAPETPLAFLLDYLVRPVGPESDAFEIDYAKQCIRQGAAMSLDQLPPDYEQIARDLIAASADINAAGPGGHTPLMKAIAGGHENMVRLLLECGADPLRRNDYDQTARDVANATSARKPILKMLIEAENAAKKRTPSSRPASRPTSQPTPRE